MPCANAPANLGEIAMALQSLIILLIVGAFIGSWLLGQLVIGAGIIGAIINATIGAIILLLIIGLVRRR
jgi:uncharacterized membrane protein YeaQ/YmgE (transglycosylase-associated protein family)